jgi:CRISPR/Cas system-associated exonuclease Cas4 (RecB family)
VGTEQGVLLAEVLSPSQVTQFLNCPAKWMFRYLLDTKDPGTAATALGKAFHETIANNFRQKQETARDLPLGECLEFFQNVLGQQLEEIRLQKGEHPMELLELGTAMVAKYLAEAAPLIQPAAVESRVSGIIGGVKVAGYVDLLDTDGRLIDSKSAIKPIRGIAHDHRLQLTSYAMITSAASGACRLDTVTKGKTVTLIQKSFCVSEKDRQYAEIVYPMVQDSIRDGIFLPRRNSSLCSKRYCGYWSLCEREYGGSVRDE